MYLFSDANCKSQCKVGAVSDWFILHYNNYLKGHFSEGILAFKSKKIGAA
jgi:hypothetical protein